MIQLISHKILYILLHILTTTDVYFFTCNKSTEQHILRADITASDASDCDDIAAEE